MNVVILGCPGAGKGTQAKALKDRFSLTHLSTGDMFRAEIKSGSTLGDKMASYMKRGMLVPDELVSEVATRVLDEVEGYWLLDGFPRTLEQARQLDEYLKAANSKIGMVINLALSEADVIARLASRRTCAGCAAVYNAVTAPPKVEGICDKCGESLFQREDDSAWTVHKRLTVYQDLTRPLVAYYREQHNFQEVDGAGTPEAITQIIAGIFDKALAAGTDSLRESRSGA